MPFNPIGNAKIPKRSLLNKVSNSYSVTGDGTNADYDLTLVKVKCSSTANIALNGSVTSLDGISLVNGDYVLVPFQTDLKENGIYIVSSSNWIYYQSINDVFLVGVSEGTLYGNSVWLLETDNIDIGTDNVEFSLIYPIQSLPSGTTDQTLRHNGTDWVANDLFRANNGTGFISGATTAHLNAGQYFFRHTAGTTYSDFLLKSTGNNVIYGFIQGADTVMWLRNSRSRFSILSDNYDAETRALIITSGVNESFYVKQSGTIKSNSLTANTFLAANSNKEIVSRNPNTIVTTTADLTVLTGTASWVDIPLLTVMLEPSVTYELQIMIAIEGAQGRAFKLRLNTAAATYVYRPFVVNTGGAGTDILYAKDASALIPQNLDNETEINFVTGNTYHHVEMKGILTTTNNIPNAKLQIYNDSLFDIVVKGYSYMKLTR